MKDLDKSALDKSVVERKIVLGHMLRCPSVAASDSVCFPIVYSQEELWARIPKGHGAKWIEKRLLNSRMCVWVCSELCRCQASCDVSSFMSKHLTPEMIMPEQKWIILPFVGKG